MKNMKIRAIVGLLAVAFAGNVAAQWIGPDYPAPGGNDFSGAGTGPAFAGGKTFTLENFDLGASGDLYYGVSSTYYPALGINGLDPSMTFSAADSDLINGMSVWTGDIVIPLSSGGSVTRDTRFTLSVSDLSSTPIAMLDSTSLSGFPTTQMGLLNVTDPAGFIANLQFDIATDASGTAFDAALTVYDGLETVNGNQLWSSVGTGFYSIPEPSSMVLIGVVAGGIFLKRRVFG